MLAQYAAHPGLFIAVACVLGLLVGSFVNVVILRLPQMMQQAWHASAADILGQQQSDSAPARVTLSSPRSACPQCHTPIAPWHNIPVLSYLLLRGRCAHCKTHISLQYPLIELTSGVLSAIVAWHFGLAMPVALALLLTWALLALTGIDWQTQFLPDSITLPLLWLGLLASLGGYFTNPVDSIIGAAAGYLFLWAIYHMFRLLTGKEGMGYGDFKLLAAIGAWLGWQALPLVVLLSSVVGLVAGIIMMATGQLGRGKAMPFGPFLAIAGWLALVAGDTLTHAYFQLAGIS